MIKDGGDYMILLLVIVLLFIIAVRMTAEALVMVVKRRAWLDATVLFLCILVLLWAGYKVILDVPHFLNKS